MARVEYIGIPSPDGHVPMASTRLGVDVSGEPTPERVAIFDASGRSSWLDASSGVSRLTLLAASDLDAQSISGGTLLGIGCAVIAVIAGDAGHPWLSADVIEPGEVDCGDAVAFQRTGGGNAGVLTLSDSCIRGDREDLSGPALIEALEAAGFRAVRYAVEPDDREAIAARLGSWCDDGSCDLILTTGGTGLSPRDCTPEATLDVIERQVPGIPELVRSKSAETVPTAWLSRAVAGIRGGTLIANLPGSRKGAVESLGFMLPLLPHALEVAGGRVSRCGG